VIDGRVKETYVKDGTATSKIAVYDPYVKFFRWATDRLDGRDGIVCMVTNNGFVDGVAFDGMRKHLLQDFTRVYHLDMGEICAKRVGGMSLGFGLGWESPLPSAPNNTKNPNCSIMPYPMRGRHRKSWHTLPNMLSCKDDTMPSILYSGHS
jgi:hypothetical protein